MSTMTRTVYSLRRAFTLVEVLIVITIITALLGMATFVSTSYVKTSRDSERESKSNIIASALERYYEESGEYPNCAVLTASPEVVKSNTLTAIANEDVLKAPRAADGANSIKCDADISPTDTDDTFVYTCTNEINPCDEWKLKYRKELDGQIVTIASKYTASSGSVGLAPPTITLAASLSGGGATASATANCATGTPEYEIKSAKNQSPLPVGWIGGPNKSESPINEGESAKFQARARCVEPGFTTSSYKSTNVATVDRTVTAPTGLTTTVAISGANGTGTVTGGSCASGTALQRQIQHAKSSYLFGGSWSGFQDITGTTQTQSIEQGWQIDFHQIARCVNTTTGVGSTWTWGPTGSAVRPISQLGAPSVTASGNASRIRYNWGGSACPTGLTKEYQWYLQREDYTSSWWGPSTGTEFDWTDVSEGYTFTAVVVQRCTSGYTSGAWSGGGSAAWARGVTAPGAPSGFKHERAGRGGIAFSWNAPVCGYGTNGQWRMDWVNGGGTGIKWINPAAGHPDHWWFGGQGVGQGYANPGTAWTENWPSFGFIGDRNNPYSVNPPRLNLDQDGVTNGEFDGGEYIGIAVEYRCRNPTTGAIGPVGNINSYAYLWP